MEVKHLQLSSTTYIIPASLFRETSGLQRLCINLSICIFGKVASYLDRVPALDYQSPQLEIKYLVISHTSHQCPGYGLVLRLGLELGLC